MSMIDYPIKFHPILKEKIWGGTKLKTILKKDTDQENIGESWELSSVKGDISVVSNGNLKGNSLKYLIEIYKEKLVGKKNYKQFGNKFPLLFKFIDAKENLSVQLHPNDKIAKERHDSFGKTEMWYVMNADIDSQLNVGFSTQMSPQIYKKSIEEKTILSKLNFETVKKGDAFFIKEGLVHAIGKGCLIAEIQQTSDITYRIYDWDRLDDNGNERELHTELAIDALDYNIVKGSKCDYNRNAIGYPEKIASCEYFTTNYINVNKFFSFDYTDLDSFVVFICVYGEGVICINDKEEDIKGGETVLIPAYINEALVKTSIGVELLEVYI